MWCGDWGPVWGREGTEGRRRGAAGQPGRNGQGACMLIGPNPGGSEGGGGGGGCGCRLGGGVGGWGRRCGNCLTCHCSLLACPRILSNALEGPRLLRNTLSNASDVSRVLCFAGGGSEGGAWGPGGEDGGLDVGVLVDEVEEALQAGQAALAGPGPRGDTRWNVSLG